MHVSVVIAHDPHRGTTTLDDCIQSIHAQGYSEIIVATEGNKSQSRNWGVQQASGDVIIFFDDDVRLRRHCISELLNPFANPMVAIVGGVNVPKYSASWRELIPSTLLSSSFTMMRSACRYTPKGDIRQADEAELILCNLAIRKKVFVEVGGLPEDVIPCEENVLIQKVIRAGYKAIYNPFAVVYHERPKLFLPYLRKLFGYGRGRGIMLRKGLGGPNMWFHPSWNWLLYPIAIVGHYCAYGLGLMIGWLTGH